MPGSSTVSTSSRMCGLESANRPMPWPRTRVHWLVVYSPSPCLRKTSFSALATSAARATGRTDHKRAANLREVACDRRRQLGGDEIAGGDAALRGRRHAQHVLAAGADD